MPRPAHDVSSEKSKNESLGPWVLGSLTPGFRACYNRSDVATSVTLIWKGNVPVGIRGRSPQTLQTPQTSESGERAAKSIPEKTSEVVGWGGLG
jgi:hypothetical protein